jgi:hypothetical protein
MKKNICMSLILTLIFLLSGFSSDLYIQIGSEGASYSTGYIPVSGVYDYSWSQVIYLNSELGESKFIEKLSYYIKNSPDNFSMNNQTIYMKHTSDNQFPSANYDDPESAGFTKVFEGSVTWDGTGWSDCIQLDRKFKYNGSDNLIIYWHNKHADSRNGSPSFKYESFSDRAKFATRDRSFPETSGYLRSYRTIIRAYYNFAIPIYPMNGEKNVAVYVEPTICWENTDSVVSNALLFSDDESAVINTSLTAMVLSPSTTVYNNYTNSSTLTGSVYYWRVLSFSSSGLSELGPVWSFSTEAAPIHSFPWYEEFENEGMIPYFWDDECLTGSNVWRYQYGGNNGNPDAPRSGAYNAILQSEAAGQKNMLVTPVINLHGYSNPMLTFWYAIPSGNYQDELRIYYKTSKTNSWALIPDAVYTANTTDWSRKTLIIPEVSDKFYIGFEGTVNGGNGICLDDVRILTSYSKLTLDVRDATGQPAPQSYCTIYAPAADSIATAHGNTDSDGLYTENGLIPGNIRYVVDNPFFNVLENQISLSGGSDFTQRVDLSVSTHITGVIRETDSEGNRIEGASVKLYTDAPESKLADSDTTDAFGRYTFSRMVNGDYRLNATHSAYFETNKNINVVGSANHDLALKPKEGNFADIYVQVAGVLSGWEIADCCVELVVKESGGSVLYTETSYADSDGNLFFRGVPAGLCRFTCNADGVHHQGWWESFTSEWLDIQNDKLVNIRLKPNKCDLTVDLDFFPVDQNGNPESPIVYVQNFWIEACGYDPDTGASLYPARTELSDHDGKVTFEQLPSLPTKITVRRPGFQTESVVVTPNAVGNFPQAVITKMRPLITPKTVWNMSVLQDIFKCIEISEEDGYWQSPVIGVEGIHNSNSEGFKADSGTSVRYIIEDGKNIPFKFNTDHEQKSAWGQSRYNIYPLEKYTDGYILVNEIDEYFYYRFDFDPFIANIVEGQTNDCPIEADVTSGKIEGTLLVADELSAQNKTIYKPRADTELHFVLHESVRQFYKDDVDTVYKVTTDNEGKYSIILPPGIYGIKIPTMVNYWGYKIDKVSFTGRMNDIAPWPYASLNSLWQQDASFSAVYDSGGYSVSSGDQNKLDLYVNKCKYVLEMPVTETSGLNNRLLYMAPDTSNQQLLGVKDCVESQTEIELSNSGGSQKVETHSSGMLATWSNLDNGTYTLAGENHPYLSSTSDVSVTTFTWGSYPGDPPSSEPPYGEDLNETPLPMIKHQLDTCEMLSDSNLTNTPAVEVTYATGDEENPIATTTRYPVFVKYKDHPDCVYSVGNVNRTRVDKYYIFFTPVGGNNNTYEVNGSGPFAVNTITQAPVGLPVSPFNMTVRAIATDNPDNTISDVPFTYEQNNYNTEKIFSGLTTSASISWGDMESEWIKGYIEYYMCPTNPTPTVFANMYCKPRVRMVGKVINSISGTPIESASISLTKADGVHNNILSASSYNSGEFYVSYAYTRDSYILNVKAPGYIPHNQRIVLDDIITGVEGGYTRYFKADTGDLLLTPISATVSKEGWDRTGHVLHGVKAAGTGETSGTTDALTMTVQASSVIPVQSYTVVPYDNSDGTPAETSMKNLDDIITEIWLVDARRKDSDDNLTPYLPADSSNYFPANWDYMPPDSDPEKILKWLDNLVNDACIIGMFKPALPDKSVSVAGSVNVADLHAGSICPALVAITKKGGRKILALETNLISSVELPRWLAFAADIMASAADAQATYGDLKETYTSKVPDGKLSALPQITGGISEDDGYLTYEYGLGIEWEEGAEAPPKGGLSVGPGMLGLTFEAEASIAFEGETQKLDFNVGGRIGKEDIDISDYMPSFLGKLGVEGNINKVGGLATTKRSSEISGEIWSEKELETMVGAYIDLMLRYNLEGITGKIPYVGPFITAADATGLLKLYGRLDLGGRVQNRSLW